MKSFKNERHVTLQQAAERLPTAGGKATSYFTLHGWANCGVEGVFLETTFRGGRLFTSHEAVQRFLAEVERRRVAKREERRKLVTA